MRDVAQAARGESRGAYDLYRLHMPGERLSEDVQRRLLDAMSELASVAHHQPMHHYWGGKLSYFATLEDWWFALHGDRLVAWCGIRLWDTPHGRVLTPENATVDPKHVRAHLGQYLFVRGWLRASLAARRPLRVVAQTSSPLVYQQSVAVFGVERVSPAVDADGEPVIDPRMTPLMEYIAGQWYPDSPYDPEASVVRAALPYAFYKRRPLSPQVRLNKYFTKYLREVPGDALIFGVRPSYRIIARAGVLARRLGKRLERLG